METRAAGGKLNPILLLLLYGAIIFAALIPLYPFFRLIVIAFNSREAVLRMPIEWTIASSFIENITKALNSIDFFSALGNSFFVSGVTTIAVLFFCSLGGYAFAKYNFPGKNFLFGFVVFTLLVPSQLSVVPMYVIMEKLAWIDTYRALIIPAMASAFGIFWMRQYISSAVHTELIEAGRIDGCSHFRVYWNIAVPIILPAFATLGIFTFLNSWNDFFLPLVVLKNEANYTVQLVLSQLNAIREGGGYDLILAAILLAMLPLIIVFLLFNKWLMNGMTIGAVKG